MRKGRASNVAIGLTFFSRKYDTDESLCRAAVASGRRDLFLKPDFLWGVCLRRVRVSNDEASRTRRVQTTLDRVEKGRLETRDSRARTYSSSLSRDSDESLCDSSRTKSGSSCPRSNARACFYGKRAVLSRAILRAVGTPRESLTQRGETLSKTPASSSRLCVQKCC